MHSLKCKNRYILFGSPWRLFPSSWEGRDVSAAVSEEEDSPTGSQSSKPPGQGGWPAVSARSSHGRSRVWSVPPWSTPHWETGQGTDWGKECICDGFNTMCYKVHIPQLPKEQLFQLFATFPWIFQGLSLGTTKTSQKKIQGREVKSHYVVRAAEWDGLLTQLQIICY